jgi:hypothetical protein
MHVRMPGRVPGRPRTKRAAPAAGSALDDTILPKARTRTGGPLQSRAEGQRLRTRGPRGLTVSRHRFPQQGLQAENAQACARGAALPARRAPATVHPAESVLGPVRAPSGQHALAPRPCSPYSCARGRARAVVGSRRTGLGTPCPPVPSPPPGAYHSGATLHAETPAFTGLPRRWMDAAPASCSTFGFFTSPFKTGFVRGRHFSQKKKPSPRLSDSAAMLKLLEQALGERR